jgi:hypothetical protein
MEQLNSTVAVLSDDPALHKRVHTLLSNVDLPELHCFQHQSINLKYHAASDLIILTLPRDQIAELSTVLDTLARDAGLAHLPVLVYIPEAEQAELAEVYVGGSADIPSERSIPGETNRSLDDGLPGGREDL